jgi:hypothetical protein
MAMNADSLGIVCVTVRTVRDMDFIIKGSIDGKDGPVMNTYLIIDDKVLDEGKTLMMVGEKMVKTLDALQKELEASHTVYIGKDGNQRYDPPVKLAFLDAKSTSDTVSNIAKNIGENEKKKKDKEMAELEAEYWADTNDIQVPKGSYLVQTKEWTVPEGVKVDFTPQRLETEAKDAPAPAAPGRPAPRKITRYATSEANARGARKVYIEEPEVVDCEEEQIEVRFRLDSYFVQVTLANGEQLCLGPCSCGLIDPAASSWKLSKGKRLTLSLEKDSKGERDRREYEKKKMEMIAKAQGEKEGTSEGSELKLADVLQPIVYLLPFVCVFIGLLLMKTQSSDGLK